MKKLVVSLFLLCITVSSFSGFFFSLLFTSSLHFRSQPLAADGVTSGELRFQAHDFKNGNATRPNIVFVLADDYGYHDIGYHGSRIRTPNLDKLADAGIKLENYYVQPTCSPSRAQFLSGRYAIHLGLQHSVLMACQADGLPLSSLTLAEKLKESGYATHLVGKWHVGFFKEKMLPQNRGFDSFFGKRVYSCRRF